MEIENRLSPSHYWIMDVDFNVEGVINNVIGPLDRTLAVLLDKVEKLLLGDELWK